MCCQDPPPAPNLDGLAESSKEIARIQQETARDQLAWSREQYNSNRQILQSVLDVQLPAMQAQFEQAQMDRERYNEVFRPLEDQFVQEAQNYDTTARREREMAAAMGDVNTQFDAQRRNSLQRLESYGVDPSMTRNSALDIGVRTAQAAAAAGAATNARNRVEDVGRALRSDAINLGRGALSNAAGFYGQAVGAGQAGVGGANQTFGTGANAMTQAAGINNSALAGYGQAGSLMNQGFANQMNRFNAQQAQRAGVMELLGTGTGLAMGMADGGDVDGDAVLPANGGRALPYDRDGTVDTGMGDGSGIDDNVPALLSDGEYVIPADVVRKKGEEFFDRLIEKYHTPASEQRRAMQ